MSPSPTTQAIEVIVERMLPQQPEMAIVRRVTPNGADIQLAFSGRYLRDVPALRGDTLEIGDNVIVMRVKSAEAQWVIIGAAASAYRGLPQGSGTTIVPVPDTPTARGRDDHIEVFWPGAKVDSVVAYELQHNSAATAVGATNVDLRTNQYDYYADQGTTRHFRVRSVGDDYVRSGWSDWDSATVSGGDISDFTGLGDTPSSYAGQACLVPVVNNAEDRLLFTALTFLGLSDTDPTYAGHASEVPMVNTGETRLTLTKLADVDHGALGGLADDDHTQYILADGTRAFTDYMDIDVHAIPAAPVGNVLRLYVEDIQGFPFFSFVDDTGMVRKIVRDSVFVAKNNTGVEIPASRAVYATGNDGGIPTVDKARANNVNTMPSIGVTLEAIAAGGGYGRVMQVGLVENVDTSAFAAGDVLYVSSAAAGILVATAPLYPNIRQEVGVILASDAVVGTVQLIARSMFNEGILDHGGLLGLTPDDDHTQYLLADGSRDLTGNMSVDAGVTIDGVDLSHHYPRHDFGGADPITLVPGHLHLGAAGDGGKIDHGAALNGLGDDDHTQYLLASGGRALTGAWDVGAFLVTFGAGIAFDGGTGVNVVTIPDNIARALQIREAGAAIEYMRIITTDAQPGVKFNDLGLDVDFHIEAVGVADAFVLRGSDGQITLGALGAGVVQSTAGGVLSSAALTVADITDIATTYLKLDSSNDPLTADLEIVDAAGAQLRLTHTAATKFVDFTLDTNHDLLIKPSSTGQIKLQATTDSVDFFQVLDADGGTPILNVDSTNERVGVGIAAPTMPLHIYGSAETKIRIETGDDTKACGFYLTEPSQEWQFSTTGAGGNFAIRDQTAGKNVVTLESGVATANRLYIDSDGNAGFGTNSPAAQLHVDQSSATAAEPVLYLDQADVDQEMIEFATTIGVGNAIEAVGGKTLTTTHFIKVTLPGALTRYIPVGTIA